MQVIRRALTGFALLLTLTVAPLWTQTPERKQVEILGQKIYYTEAGAELVVFGNYGHVPPLESTPTFNEVLNKFL